MELSKTHLTDFHSGDIDNAKYWARHGGMPDFTGKTVLDVGSGQGRLCYDMARAGAARVVGLDIRQESVDFATENIRQNHREVADAIEFQCLDLSEYPDDAQFDIVVSKNSFEHILDLEGMLAEIKKRLKPGGLLYTGFGPLWRAPYGDHWMIHKYLPWGHLLRREKTVLEELTRRFGREFKSLDELYLNRFSFAKYKQLLERSGLETVRFRVNQSTNPIVRLCSVVRALPLLKEYFTINLFCIMKKPENPQDQ